MRVSRQQHLTSRFSQPLTSGVRPKRRHMPINTSGKWWVGSSPEDIKDFLEAYSADGYRVHEFRLSRCNCGSVTFRLEADDTEGVARRICSQCGEHHYICDSGEYWDEAEPVVC